MTKWYSAHLVQWIRFKEGAQDHVPAYEDVVLVRAASRSEAWAEAERLGKERSGDDGGTLSWLGRPATLVFAGVRKLVLCEEPDERPGHGTEVTYTEIELPDEAALARYVAGASVRVKLADETGATDGSG